MAKRFCDTEIFKKKWFRSLPTKYRLMFFYLFTNCDLAGIWEVDFDQVSFFVDKTVTQEKSLQLLEKHIMVIEPGKKWLLVDFIPFQYGDHLNEKSPVHKKIIDILKKYSINGNTLYDTLYNRVSYRVKEEDKDKEEEKDKEKDSAEKSKIPVLGVIPDTSFQDAQEQKIMYSIEHCLVVAMNDDRWVRANKATEKNLKEFNALLERRGDYQKNPLDYKKHFANWKQSGKKDDSPPKVDTSHVSTARENKARQILNS